MKVNVSAPIVAILLVCLGISIQLLFKRPQDVVPRDPRSIGGISLLLQANREMSHHFRSSFEYLRYHLQHERFATIAYRHKFAILREGMNPSFSLVKGETMGSDNKWWRPAALTPLGRIMIILVPLMLIGALEGVQQASDRLDGITTIVSPDNAHYASTIIPAMIMWGVGSLFSSANFHTVILAPYMALSNGSIRDRSLFSRTLGRLPAVQLIHSIREKHSAVLFTSMACVVGPFLLIVSSSLYSIVPKAGATVVMGNELRQLNTSWQSTDDRVISLSYSSWTRDDIVILDMLPSSLGPFKRTSSKSLSWMVPARRASLDCAVVEAEDLSLEAIDARTPVYAKMINNCHKESEKTVAISLLPDSPTSLMDISSLLTPIHRNAGDAPALGRQSSETQPTSQTDCISHTILQGPNVAYVEAGDEALTTDDRTSALVCKPRLHELDVVLNFEWPGLRLSGPPLPDEAGARLLNNGTGKEILVIHSSSIRQSSPSIYNASSVTTMTMTPDSLDAFHQAVLATWPSQSLNTINKANFTDLINITSKAYGRYMAQAMARQARSVQSHARAQSTTTPPQPSMIIQNRGPKLALQIILGVMALCGIGAWACMRDTRILPHNPCSIAGVAALLAGGELWKGEGEPGRGFAIPDGGEWMSDRDVREQGLWKDVVFGLGWWPDGRFGIDAGGPIDGG